MNPTASLFIKLSILVSLSLQVYASEVFGSSGSLGNIQDELHALRHSRRQLQRRQTVEVATPTVKEDNLPTQEASTAKGDAGSKNRKFSKEEELAGQVFETIIQMGGGLESVTSLGSTTKEIVEHSKKVQSLIPKFSNLTTDLMATIPQKSDALNKSFSAATEAGNDLTKSLQAIDQKPEDANLIKENFKTLEKSFNALLSTADNVAIAAIPKLSELIKNEEKTAPGEEVAGLDKTGVTPGQQSTETKPDGGKTGELRAADPKAADPKAADPKAAEPKAADPKAAEPKAAEPKGIEPIVPDVVVPQQ